MLAIGGNSTRLHARPVRLKLVVNLNMHPQDHSSDNAEKIQMSEQEKEPKPTKISFNEDDGLTINLEAIESVGIKNILDLKAYNMSRDGDRVMHIFEFHDGGHCELTFSYIGLDTGKLEVFRAHRACVDISGGTQITIGKYEE